MEKVTQVNIDGRNYQFLAGQAVQGSCASRATDWTKIIDLPGETGIVDGTFLVIDFTYGNEVGFGVPRTVYSDDGENFYWDDQFTDPVTLPSPSNYEATLVSGEEYSLIEFPVLSLNNQAFPVCDARGRVRGGDLWVDGDSVILLFVDSKFFALAAGGSQQTIKVYPTIHDAEADLDNLDVGQIIGTEEGGDSTIDAVVKGDYRAISSNAVAEFLEPKTITLVDNANVRVVVQYMASVAVMFVYAKVQLSPSIDVSIAPYRFSSFYGAVGLLISGATIQGETYMHPSDDQRLVVDARNGSGSGQILGFLTM